jgi:hypothetical protein
MVRSEQVVSQRKQTDLLSLALKAKVNRYICRWKRRYHGQWPKYPLQLSAGSQPPSLMELWTDWITYQVVLCQDKMIAVIYAVLPIDVARWLRCWRNRATGSLSTS